MVARKLFNGSTNLAVVALASLLVLAGTFAEAQDEAAKWWGGNELRLDLVNTNFWVESIYANGGWQLTVNMQARDRKLLGIGVPTFPPDYPQPDTTGYFVFDDPDYCPSFVALGWQVGAYAQRHCQDPPAESYPGCDPPFWPDDPDWPDSSDWGYGPFPDCPPPWNDEDEGAERQAWIDALAANGISWDKDETWAEFTPGTSFVDPVATDENREQRPVTWYWGRLCNPDNPEICTVYDWFLAPYGPELGSIHDDITYGHSRRIPGLVVVADHGPGVRWVPPQDGGPFESFFDTYEPAQAWNLAGFVNSVAYSLKGGTTESSLLAHMNVPAELFKPVILGDNSLDDPESLGCSESTVGVYRMDGGPLTCVEGFFGNHVGLIYDTTVTVRVFMVDSPDGKAPDILYDEDGDGDIDIRDAELMGYDPISRQKTLRFRQYPDFECDFRFDFDDNGESGFCVAPGRPGGIVRPPR